MDDENEKLVALSYGGSAESAFVILAGEAIAKVGATPGGALHARNLLKSLSSASAPAVLSEAERDRFRTMQRLFVATFSRFRFPERVDKQDQTMQ